MVVDDYGYEGRDHRKKDLGSLKYATSSISEEELAYRLEWHEWRGSVSQKIDAQEVNNEIRMEKYTDKVKTHIDLTIAEHEAKEMRHLKKINTFMWQVKVAAAMLVTGVVTLTQVGGFF